MKTKFILHLNGPEGCDYTIGCGIKVVELEAQTFEDAKIESEKIFEDHDPDHIESARIISVVDITDLDFEGWQSKKIQEREIEESLEVEKMEREQLANLSKKYAV